LEELVDTRPRKSMGMVGVRGTNQGIEMTIVGIGIEIAGMIGIDAMTGIVTTRGARVVGGATPMVARIEEVTTLVARIGEATTMVVRIGGVTGVIGEIGGTITTLMGMTLTDWFDGPSFSHTIHSIPILLPTWARGVYDFTRHWRS